MRPITELAASKGHGSLRALALAVTSRKGWPPDRLTATSLANRLRMTDAGRELDWWRKTGADVLPHVAAELGVEAGALQAQFELGARATSRQAMWRFPGFEDLAPLDLRTEPPPPWIPLTKFTWSSDGVPIHPRVVWVISARPARDLVIAWLKLRGWQVTGGALDDAREQVRRGGCKLIWVEDRPLTPEALADLAVQATSPLLVLVAAPPPSMAEDRGDVERTSGSLPWAWIEERTFDVRWHAKDVIRYVAERAPESGGLDPERLVRWLDSVDGPPAHWFTSADEFLGFLGVVDEVGLDFIEAADPRRPGQVVAAWLRATLSRLGGARPTRAGLSGLRDQVFGLAGRAIVAGRFPGASREEWTGLLRLGLPGPDSAAALAALEADGAEGSARAIMLLRDPADATAAEWCRVGVLLSDGAALRLGPPWLERLLLAGAIESLRGATLSQLGALALRPERLPEVLELIEGRLGREGWDIARQLLQEDLQEPAFVALLEALIIAAGSAVAAGNAPSHALAHELWRAGLAACGVGGSLSWPSPMFARPVGGPRWPSRWRAGLLLLSSACSGAKFALSPGALSPWSAAQPWPQEWCELLATLGDEVQHHQSEALTAVGWELVRRGLTPRPRDHAPRCALAALLVAAARDGTSLSSVDADDVASSDLDLRAVLWLGARAGVPEANCLRLWWTTVASARWNAVNCPWITDDAFEIPGLWDAVPCDPLPGAVADFLGGGLGPRAWPRLPAPVWPSLLCAWDARGWLPGGCEEAAPPAALLCFLLKRDRPPASPAAADRVWACIPDAVDATIVAKIEDPAACIVIEHLLERAPDDRVERHVPRLATLLSGSDLAARDLALRSLTTMVGRRRPGWLAAFRALRSRASPAIP